MVTSAARWWDDLKVKVRIFHFFSGMPAHLNMLLSFHLGSPSAPSTERAPEPASPGYNTPVGLPQYSNVSCACRVGGNMVQH